MIKMTDKELVDYVFEMADWNQDTCSTVWDWAREDMFYILNRIFCVVLNEDGIWEKDENCRVSDPMEYWKGLIEEVGQERCGEDLKEKEDALKKEVLKELQKIKKLLEER